MPDEETKKLTPEDYEDSMVFDVRIKTIDDRGYYICDDVGFAGLYYLHSDGIVRRSVNVSEEYTCFWPSKQAANEYWRKWQLEKINAGNNTTDSEKS